MKLVFYMLKKFFVIFLGALVFFVLILCLTELLMNLWNYISKQVPSKQVMKIMFFYVPKTVWYAVPIAMLFATAYMLSDFYAKNELLAIFASGVSLFKFASPLLLVGLVFSGLLFVWENNVVVGTYAQFNKLKNEAFKKEVSLNQDNIVIMSEEGNVVYKADYYDDELQRLYTVYVLVRTEDKKFDRLFIADSALWNEDHWDLSNPTVYRQYDDGITIVPYEREFATERFTEPPETFRNNTVSVEEVNTKEARAYIEHLEKAGLPSSAERSEYYKKFAFPFVVLIVVFLAVGLSGKTRKNVLIISLALSVTAVVLFYVTQMVTMLMAKFGTIPPVMGAWFPVVLFIFISSVLLKFAKT
ncbi:MAG: LptF/LptG family permease [Treponema sp.]|nr:LptF/LptG family permease [Treponema sp.]